jgi:hypothetical protein
MLRGDNSSYVALGRFPAGELARILPRDMSVPSAEVMADRYPELDAIDGTHPVLMLFSHCRNVHDVITEITLRPYRELMFFIPVTYSRGGQERLCSYVPVLYLDYLIGVVGGLYLGLRKQFHPRMRDVEADATRRFTVGTVLDASFEELDTGGGDLDPFFARTLANPTTTRSYFGRARFYTTTVDATEVTDVAADIVWRFKGSEVRNEMGFPAHHVEYRFTTSQAMSYEAYFHPRHAPT